MTAGGACPAFILALCLAGAPGAPSRAEPPAPGTNALARFPCNPAEIAHYTAYRASGVVHIDGRLDEPCWLAAPRSPRFIDILTGKPTLYDTRAAVLWDDLNLYVGFWVEEPKVKATLTKHGSHIYENNDVEVFIAGRDTYYEFEINALNTVYEAFFIWEDAYDKGGYAEAPEFRRSNPEVKPFNGVGFTNHPRGLRLGSWAFEFPGLKTAVHVDGTLNEDSDTDRGWTVELAFPWAGMKRLTVVPCRPETEICGALIFHASTNTRHRRRRRIPAAGFGAGMGCGTLMFLNAFPTFISRPMTSSG